MSSRRSWIRRTSIAAAAAAALAAGAAVALAQPLPDLDFDPAPTVDQLRSDLAETVLGAVRWLMDAEEGTVSAWVWRVPGDPDPIGLFADADWAGDPHLMVRDLGEAMHATVEVYADYFEAADPGWSDRALALAERLAGVEQRIEMHSVVGERDGAFYGVQVSDRFVDLRTLEAFEGTWVHVTRVLD